MFWNSLIWIFLLFLLVSFRELKALLEKVDQLEKMVIRLAPMEIDKIFGNLHFLQKKKNNNNNYLNCYILQGFPAQRKVELHTCKVTIIFNMYLILPISC